MLNLLFYSSWLKLKLFFRHKAVSIRSRLTRWLLVNKHSLLCVPVDFLCIGRLQGGERYKAADSDAGNSSSKAAAPFLGLLWSCSGTFLPVSGTGWSLWAPGTRSRNELVVWVQAYVQDSTAPAGPPGLWWPLAGRWESKKRLFFIVQSCFWQSCHFVCWCYLLWWEIWEYIHQLHRLKWLLWPWGWRTMEGCSIVRWEQHGHVLPCWGSRTVICQPRAAGEKQDPQLSTAVTTWGKRKSARTWSEQASAW